MVMIGLLLLCGALARRAGASGSSTRATARPCSARRHSARRDAAGGTKAAGVGLLLHCPAVCHAALLLAAVASSPLRARRSWPSSRCTQQRAALLLGPALWLRLLPAALRRSGAASGPRSARDLAACASSAGGHAAVGLSLFGHGPWAEALIAWCSRALPRMRRHPACPESPGAPRPENLTLSAPISCLAPVIETGPTMYQHIQVPAEDRRSASTRIALEMSQVLRYRE